MAYNFMNAKGSDVILATDAEKHIWTADNPFTMSLLNSEGCNMLRAMMATAESAIREAAKDGKILRADAVRVINETLDLPPAGLHHMNISAWGSIKAMIKESMCYPAPYEPPKEVE